MNCKNLVYLDLFSGTGGFAKGLQQAGFTFSKHYFSEIDKFAIANYQYNFKDSLYAGSINEIKGKKIAKPDLITFGFPCQDISIAAHGKGLKGKRSSLFFEAVRIIREYRPALFIFENVKGLFSSNQGKDFEIVLKEIADIGLYDCQWQLLNTAWFLPQNRERVYFIGHPGGKPSPKVFPFQQGDGLFKKGNKEKSQGENIATAITSTYSKGVHARGETYVDMLYRKNSKEKWEQGKATRTPTLKTQSDLTRKPLIIPLKMERSEKAKKIRKESMKNEKDYSPFAEKELAPRVDGKTGTLTSSLQKDNILLVGGISKKKGVNSNRYSQGDRIYSSKGTSTSLIAAGHKTNFYTTNSGIRRLTPTECERLQGFSDGWTSKGILDGKEIDISDTQRYKLLGNAVSVPVVEAIGKRLLSKEKNDTTLNLLNEQALLLKTKLLRLTA